MNEGGPSTMRKMTGLAAILIAALAVVLVGVIASAPVAQAGGRGLVTGVVVMGPMLPIDPGASVEWPAQKAVVRAYVRGTDTLVRTLHSGADGRFSVRLDPGRYRFRAEPAGVSTLPIPHNVSVKVVTGQTARIRLWLDTGLRFPAAENVKPGEAPGGQQKYPQGLVGTTRRGPIAPVSRPGEPNDQPCAATLTLYRYDGSQVATVASTAAHGFAVSLPAGRYIVEPHSALSPMDRAGPFSIRVPAREWLSLTILFDTGIRFAGSAPAPR